MGIENGRHLRGVFMRPPLQSTNCNNYKAKRYGAAKSAGLMEGCGMTWELARSTTEDHQLAESQWLSIHSPTWWMQHLLTLLHLHESIFVLPRGLISKLTLVQRKSLPLVQAQNHGAAFPGISISSASVPSHQNTSILPMENGEEYDPYDIADILHFLHAE